LVCHVIFVEKPEMTGEKGKINIKGCGNNLVTVKMTLFCH